VACELFTSVLNEKGICFHDALQQTHFEKVTVLVHELLVTVTNPSQLIQQ